MFSSYVTEALPHLKLICLSGAQAASDFFSSKRKRRVTNLTRRFIRRFSQSPEENLVSQVSQASRPLVSAPEPSEPADSDVF